MNHDRKPNFRAEKVPACFAPPITADLLDRYAELAAAAPPAVRDAMNELAAMVRLFLETPRSTRPGKVLPMMAMKNGVLITTATAVPLEDAEVDRMWEAVPWDHQLNAMGVLFDSIDNATKRELRDAAVHLLWYGRELVRDREPMTNDRL